MKKLNGKILFSAPDMCKGNFCIGVMCRDSIIRNEIAGDGFVDYDDYRILENNVPLGISTRIP